MNSPKRTPNSPAPPPGIDPEEFQEAVQEENKLKGEAIRRLWEEHPELTPNEVQKELAGRGLHVSRPMVYKVRNELRRATVAGTTPTLEELKEVKRLAARFGGIERLKIILEMLEELQV
jgi:hypothetical protein